MGVFQVLSRLSHLAVWVTAFASPALKSSARESLLQFLNVSEPANTRALAVGEGSLLECGDQCLSMNQIENWPEVSPLAKHAAERAALIQLLNVTGMQHVDPESLVQIPPLLIAGGIAAAVAAVGIAVIGTIGLTLGLMAAFGVFNSHKDRRRKKDTNLPCESTNPLDTNDKDCFVYRWDKMVWYFSYHAHLKRLEKINVQGADEATALWAKTMTLNEQHENQIYGHAGTFLRPSKSSGIFHEASVLKSGAEQLNEAGIASIETLYRTLESATEDSFSDVRELKDNIAKAYSSLTDDVALVMKKQDRNAQLNAGTMNKAGTKILSDSVDTVLGSQKTSTETMIDVARTGNGKIKEVEGITKDLGARLDDGEDFAEKAAERIEARNATFRVNLDSAIDHTLKEITTKAEDSQKHVSDELRLLTTEFRGQTIGEVKRSTVDLKNATSAVRQRSQALADAADSQIVTALVSGQSTVFKQGTSNVTTLLGDLQTSILKKTQDGTHTTSDLGNTAAVLSTEANSETKSVDGQSRETISYVDEGVRSIKQRVVQALQSQGVSKDGIDSLMQALNGAQTDASKSLKTGENEYVGDVSDVLNKLGTNGLASSASVGNLMRLISTGAGKTGADLTQQLDYALVDSKSKGAALLSRLSGAGIDLTKLSSMAGSELKKLGPEILAAVRGENGDVSRLLAGVGGSDLIRSRLLSDERVGFTTATGIRESSKSALSALQNARAGLSSLDAFVGAVSEGSSGSVAELATALAGGDESARAVISGELNKALLLTKSSTTPGEVNLKQIVRSALKEIERKNPEISRIVNENINGKTRTLDKSRLLISSAQALNQQTDEVIGKTGQKQSDLVGSYKNRLADISGADGSKPAVLNGISAADIDQTTIGTVLKSEVDLRKKQIGQRTDESATQLRVIQDSTGTIIIDMKKLERELGLIVGSDSAASIANELNRLTSATTNDDSISGQLNRLSSSLSVMKTTTASAISNVSSALQAEILQLPLAVISGTAALERDMRLVSSDLEAKIRQTKEALATAQTEEERQAAIRGLIVLGKLQAVQQGVLQADYELRKRLAAGETTAMNDDKNVQAAMATVLGAISTLTGGIEAAKLDARKQSSTVSSSVSDIYTSLRSMVLSTNESVTASAAQTALAGAIAFASEQERTQQRDFQAVRLGQFATETSSSQWMSNTNAVTEISRMLDELNSTSAQSSVGISDRVDQVLRDVSLAASATRNNATGGENDVLTQLALVRMAMASFMSLWNEYALAVDDRQTAIVRGDHEFLASVETDMKRELIRGERIVNSTGVELDSFVHIVNEATSAESDFESSVFADLRSLRSDLDGINSRRNAQVINNSDHLDDAINVRTKEEANRLEQIDSVLDQFHRLTPAGR